MCVMCKNVILNRESSSKKQPKLVCFYCCGLLRTNRSREGAKLLKTNLSSISQLAYLTYADANGSRFSGIWLW